MHYFEGAKGNTYFMWREDPNNPSHLFNRENVITVIQNALLKYFSCANEKSVWIIVENVHLIYREITGDYSTLDTKQPAKFDPRM